MTILILYFSYDEELIVWDDRNMRQPLTSANLGGGVWRIKWDPFSGENILTATMYNGTHIIDASNLGMHLKLLTLIIFLFLSLN